ncbi:Uncharacterised protein [Mycobacteroides abscessus subsp. abscessus]|nr:Uncharacterised protein [Mycobacteroides abscessus subsp. abscessus]
MSRRRPFQSGSTSSISAVSCAVNSARSGKKNSNFSRSRSRKASSQPARNSSVPVVSTAARMDSSMMARLTNQCTALLR